MWFEVFKHLKCISSVAQSVRLFATPWTAVRQASLSITNSWSLLRPMSIERYDKKEDRKPQTTFILLLIISLKTLIHSMNIYWQPTMTSHRQFLVWDTGMNHVVMYGCESWTIKKAESWRIDAFELWCPRDSQESSPTPQFKSINSSALNFLYSRTLTSMHDHWKNHSLS